jgi:thiamine-phosphate pyrophosphorylase
VSDFALVAIVGPPFVDAASVLDACRKAEAGGATAVQVRFKRASAAAILGIATRLVDELAIPIYINDRADIALAAGARGVHLGAEDIAPAAVREFAPRPFRIGVSVGTDDEAKAVAGADVDYWSIGSVYRTGSKADAGEPVGIRGFRALARRAPPRVPVIAIGGIDATNVREVLEAGADGVAVISAIFGAPDVERSTRALKDVVEAVRSRRPA